MFEKKNYFNKMYKINSNSKSADYFMQQWIIYSGIGSNGRILEANLSWSPTGAKSCQLIASFSSA